MAMTAGLLVGIAVAAMGHIHDILEFMVMFRISIPHHM